MKLDCCGGAEKALGVLLIAAFFLVGCTNDGESLAVHLKSAMLAKNRKVLLE